MPSALARIVVIDSDASEREDIVSLLTAEGFSPVAAAGGVEGIRLSVSIHPDLILCDVRTCDLDGWKVLETVRTHPTLQSTPVVLLSASAGREEARRGMDLGADDFIVRPFTGAELTTSVRSRLRRYLGMKADYEGAISSLTANLHRLERRVGGSEFFPLLSLHEFHQRFDHWRDTATPEGEQPFLVITIDDFESLDADSRAAVEAAAAGRFETWVGDQAWLCEAGEGRFALFLTSAVSREEGRHVAELLIDAVSHPIYLHELGRRITCSIGIAAYPLDGADLDSLLRRASAAANQAAVRGGNQWWFHTPRGASLPASPFQPTATDLRHILEHELYTLHFQPILSLSRPGAPIAAEALFRYTHPIHGAIPPETFFQLVREQGLDRIAFRAVFSSACRQLSQWSYRGLAFSYLSVNLTPSQLVDPQLIGMVSQILTEYGLEARQIQFEITEEQAIEDWSLAAVAASRLKALGAGLALDDFGSGAASLRHVGELPLDRVKLDRGFLRTLSEGSKGSHLAGAILRLMKELAIKVTAEGVQTAEQIAWLSSNNCESVQGFGIGKPLRAVDFESEWLRSVQPHHSLVCA
jgi:EAL domain-containing protein (putative c-di-GMP-specific phosphodiesterase class I)/CheY-like chemotaxis protein